MPETPTTDQIDTRIARAIDGVKELLDARMETFGAKLDAINERLNEQAKVHEDVEDLKSRMVAAEAFISSQEKRLGEARAYRKLHRPTLLLSSLGLVVALAAVVAGFFH